MFKRKSAPVAKPSPAVPPVPRDPSAPAKRERFLFLYGLIMDHGQIMPKRHGHWVKLDLNGDFFLELDSWNKAIHLKRGTEPEFNEWTGWKARSINYLGSDWGGYEPHVRAAALEEVIEAAQAAIARRGQPA
jgi:hypothetical protein